MPLYTHNGKLIVHSAKLAVANECCCTDSPEGCFVCNNQPDNGSLKLTVAGLVNGDCPGQCRCSRPISGELGCQQYVHDIQIHNLCSVMNRTYNLRKEPGVCCWSLNLGDLTCAHPGLLVAETDPCVADFPVHLCTKDNNTVPNNDTEISRTYLHQVRVCISRSGTQASGTVSWGATFTFTGFSFINGVCSDVSRNCLKGLTFTCFPKGSLFGSGTYANFCAGVPLCLSTGLQFTNCTLPNTTVPLTMCLSRTL